MAVVPSSSSMRRSWLYLAVLSVLEAEPVFICPALVATLISAMVASSVSPLRREVTAVDPAPPRVLGTAVLDGYDRECLYEPFEVIDHLIGRYFLSLKHISAVLV